LQPNIITQVFSIQEQSGFYLIKRYDCAKIWPLRHSDVFLITRKMNHALVCRETSATSECVCTKNQVICRAQINRPACSFVVFNWVSACYVNESNSRGDYRDSDSFISRLSESSVCFAARRRRCCVLATTRHFVGSDTIVTNCTDWTMDVIDTL